MDARRQKLDHIANWLTLLAMPGILAFILTITYDIYLFRTNPASPDALHSIERVEHGSHRYFTPLQARICAHPFIGLIEGFTLLTAATFVRNGCKFKKT